MRINPINKTSNATFGTRIKYNQTMQKGFELAKSSADSCRKKDLDFAKNFADNIRTILENTSEEKVAFEAKKSIGVFTEIRNGEKIVLNDYIPNEGYKCTIAANKYAEKLDKPTVKTHIDTLKSQLEGAISLVETLKEQYSQALKDELNLLENKVKKSDF